MGNFASSYDEGVDEEPFHSRGREVANSIADTNDDVTGEWENSLAENTYETYQTDGSRGHPIETPRGKNGLRVDTRSYRLFDDMSDTTGPESLFDADDLTARTDMAHKSIAPRTSDSSTSSSGDRREIIDAEKEFFRVISKSLSERSCVDPVTEEEERDERSTIETEDTDDTMRRRQRIREVLERRWKETEMREAVDVLKRSLVDTDTEADEENSILADAGDSEHAIAGVGASRTRFLFSKVDRQPKEYTPANAAKELNKNTILEADDDGVESILLEDQEKDDWSFVQADDEVGESTPMVETGEQGIAGILIQAKEQEIESSLVKLNGENKRNAANRGDTHAEQLARAVIDKLHTGAVLSPTAKTQHKMKKILEFVYDAVNIVEDAVSTPTSQAHGMDHVLDQFAVEAAKVAEGNVDPNVKRQQMKAILEKFAVVVTQTTDDHKKNLHVDTKPSEVQVTPKQSDGPLQETAFDFNEATPTTNQGKKHITPTTNQGMKHTTPTTNQGMRGSGHDTPKDNVAQVNKLSTPVELMRTLEEFEGIDVNFVNQYEKTFNAFLLANPQLVNGNANMVKFLRVAKLKKILEVTQATEIALKQRLQHVQEQKQTMTTNYQNELLDAAKEKAARGIRLQRDLDSMKEACITKKGELNWNIVLKHQVRAQNEVLLLQQLCETQADPQDPLAILPKIASFDAIRAAVSVPPGSGELNDKQLRNMQQLQLDNSFLNAEVTVLERKLAYLKGQAKTHNWVNTIFRQLTPEGLEKLKKRYQEKLGATF